MKLSIIIPVFNVFEWLPTTIQSVLNQNFPDFELILVNDGSTDGSSEICNTYAQQDDRIRVIHQQNAGVSAARNTGLDAARGEYIGWVDSDDIIEKNMFRHLLLLAEKTNADIVQCQHDREAVLCDPSESPDFLTLSGTEYVFRMFKLTGSSYTNQAALWSKIYRRHLWNDIRFPVGRVYEDEMQTYKVCLKANKIVETNDVLYHYIKRENSIITGESAKKMLDKQAALLDRLHYLPQHIPELERRSAEAFLNYSKHILCRMYETDSEYELQTAISVLLRNKKYIDKYVSIYDRINMYMLSHLTFRSVVLKNNFVPIQQIISKLLWWKYKNQP